MVTRAMPTHVAQPGVSVTSSASRELAIGHANATRAATASSSAAKIAPSDTRPLPASRAIASAPAITASAMPTNGGTSGPCHAL